MLLALCVTGAVTRQVEKWVQEVLDSTPAHPEGTPPNTLFIPDCVSSEVLQYSHTSRVVCHPGLRRTLHFLCQCFWWPSMTHDTQSFMAACLA